MQNAQWQLLSFKCLQILSVCTSLSWYKINYYLHAKSYYLHSCTVYSNELSIPLGEEECLEVPKLAKQQSLYAAWPEGDGTDSICPLCNDGRCVLSNCECYTASALQPELKSNSSGSTVTYSLCWSNLIADRNNSKIFFFFEELICLENDKSSFLSRKYDTNSIFVLRGISKEWT